VVNVSKPATPRTPESPLYEVVLNELLAAGYPPEEFAAERVDDGLIIRLTFSSDIEMSRELLRTIAAYTYYILSELPGTRNCMPGSFKFVIIEVRQADSELAERIEVDSRNHPVYYAIGFVAGLLLKKGLYIDDVSIRATNGELRIDISTEELKALRRLLYESKAETWKYLALSLYMSPICSTARSCGLKLALIVRGGFRRTATLICV